MKPVYEHKMIALDDAADISGWRNNGWEIKAMSYSGVKLGQQIVLFERITRESLAQIQDEIDANMKLVEWEHRCIGE